jgi:hypothetical protein
MGKQHQVEVPVTQANVDEALASSVAAGALAPQERSQLEGQALCGRAVRMLVGAHMETVFLTDFDIASNSYHGLAVRCFSMNSGENPPIFEAVHGARPYPQEDEPNYAFQFVNPAIDESVLVNIAHRNLLARQAPADVSPDVSPDPVDSEESGNQ